MGLAYRSVAASGDGLESWAAVSGGFVCRPRAITEGAPDLDALHDPDHHAERETASAEVQAVLDRTLAPQDGLYRRDHPAGRGSRPAHRGTTPDNGPPRTMTLKLSILPSPHNSRRLGRPWTGRYADSLVHAADDVLTRSGVFPVCPDAQRSHQARCDMRRASSAASARELTPSLR